MASLGQAQAQQVVTVRRTRICKREMGFRLLFRGEHTHNKLNIQFTRDYVCTIWRVAAIRTKRNIIAY